MSLADQLPGAVAGPPLLPPVAGALLLAMDAATKPLAPAVLEGLLRAFHTFNVERAQ